MKFSYKFSNLLGSVYRRGNLAFTPDGGSVISPVGNRITVFDLKSNKSETLPFESNFNITTIAVSPNGYTLIVVNEEGEALLCSLISRTVLHRYHFHCKIRCVKFSPDGSKFAVTKEDKILVFYAPGKDVNFNPFQLLRIFYGAYEDNVCIDWTTDSRAICTGSKDMSVRVYGVERLKNLLVYSLTGHGDAVVGTFFLENSLDLYSVAANGIVNLWRCDTQLDGLVHYKKKKEIDETEMEEEEEEEGGGGGGGGESSKKSRLEESKARRKQDEAEESIKNKVKYRKAERHNLKKSREKTGEVVLKRLTSAVYNKQTNLMVSGFEDGSFFIHEMPRCNLIHSLSISDQIIGSVEFNKTGDWIAMGCCGLGQLLVWEWQSESYILKQQGHFNNMTCLEYSPDGHYLATGGDDAKVKVWNTSNGFCFVTFSEHTAGITGVTFNQRGQVIISCSLDGTVRAYDLNRYRNFRTFTSPQPVQFSCLAIDSSGDIVCAGSQDSFEIFVWSMKTGRLLDVLSGHEAPVSGLAFSSTGTMLASSSWDKTVKLWDIFENKGSRESLLVNSDVLAVAFRPDGRELAVATLDASITFWDPQTAVQVGSIEGRHDIGYFRKLEDKITAKKSATGQAFNTICYSADGKALLAAGRSKNICIYSVADQILMKKFEISCNKSFDGMEEFLDKRQMTEWGNLALIDDEDDEDGPGKNIALPGVRKGDMSSRHWKPEVRVCCVRFSPTGRSWAAASTEGVLVYSLDHKLHFDPFELQVDITPESVRKTLAKGDYSSALMMSFRLNEQILIEEIIEKIPYSQIEFLAQNLPENYVDRLLLFLPNQIESSAHLQFYLTWLEKLLMSHGPSLKQRSGSIITTFRSLQKATRIKHDDISKLCEYNKYTLQFMLNQFALKRKIEEEKDEDGSEAEGNDDDDAMETDDDNAFISKWTDEDDSDT